MQITTSGYNFNFAPQGWQCPICKRVYSPTTPWCYYCGGASETYTSTSGGTYPVDHPISDTVTTPYKPNELNFDCWGNAPTLLTSHPPKLAWKCRYCGKERITEITEKPVGNCSCLTTNVSKGTYVGSHKEAE